MLAKRLRLSKKSVNSLIQKSRKVHKKTLRALFSFSDTIKTSHIGVVVPKSVYKGAVQRNVLRRLIYHCFSETFLKALPFQAEILFFTQKDAREASKELLCADVEATLKEISGVSKNKIN